jgi:hypothetical protein
VRFLTCGTLGWRLAEEAEVQVTGEFPELDTHATTEGAPLAAYMDGWALHSPAPDRLVAEARRLAGSN